MMRVLVVHAPRLLVEELARRGLDIVVANASQQSAVTLPDASRCRFVSFPYRQKLDPRAIRDMRRIIREHRPDLIHAFSPRSLATAVVATIGMRSAPAIMSFRGISTPPKWRDPSDLLTFLSRRVIAHACESEAVADGLVQAGITRDACHVVYNCVDRAALGPQDRHAIRERFGIPHNAFVIGSVASIRPVKGIDILLDAAVECLDLDDLYVLLVGPIKDAAVAKRARDPRWAGRLRLAGFVPAGGGLARGFDVFAMPSRHEGLCRALLEAMSMETCPIVSDAGGMKELVRHEREGLVVPRCDGNALSAAIRHLHARRSLISEYAAAARRRVESMCSPVAMADRVERSYQAVSRQAATARR